MNIFCICIHSEKKTIRHTPNSPIMLFGLSVALMLIIWIKFKKIFLEILKVVKNNLTVVKNCFITKKSTTGDFFGQKSKKIIVMFFAVLLYGTTP